MAILEEDTLYFRWDHPNGFMFSAGNEAPSVDDGWAAAQEDVEDGPVVTYECTTLAAFQALLDSERNGAVVSAANYQSSLAQARAAVGAQQMIIDALRAELEALSMPVEEQP